MHLPALALAAALAAAVPPLHAQTAPACENCGTVKSVERSSEPTAGWSPLGSVAPGTYTGMGPTGATTTAFSIGRGGVNQGIVTLGAAGGAAYARRPQSYEKPRWDVVVQMDAGDTRTIPASYDPLVQPGDRVRVYGTQLEPIAGR